MVNRDFSKSGKSYIAKNKVVLIALSLIIAVGIIMLCALGFNGGTEVSGYKTFSIKMGSSYDAEKLDDYMSTINGNLVDYDGYVQSVQLTGEGDSTTLIVKYSGKVSSEGKLNAALAQDLKVDLDAITDHVKVGASLTNSDYVFAVACGLIILALAAVYIAFRYNLACTITAIGGSVLGVALLMAITVIFRLTINSSFLAINIITTLLVLGESFMLFDGLEKEREKLQDKYDRNTQLTNALKLNAFRQKLMYGAIFAVALMFVILMPTAIKQASIISLFATVVTMFIAVYALPFLWSLTITQISDKIRVKKVKKVKTVQATEEVEGELEKNYTENQVIEVKEDDGKDNVPSNDDNITIE